MDTSFSNLAECILNDVSDWLYAKDTEDRYVFANRAMCSALGLSWAVIEGQTDASLFKFRQPLSESPLHDSHTRAGTQHRTELLTLPSGRQFTMQTTVFTPSAAIPRVYDTVWVSRPVGSAPDDSAALIEDLEKLHTLFDNIDAHLYIKDENRRYRYLNPPVAEFFGVPVEQILGKSDPEIFSPEIAKMLDEHDSPVYVANQLRKIEESITIPSGQQRTFVSVKMPWKNSRGMTELLGISTDITELVRTRHIEKLRTDVLESMAQGDPLRETLSILIQQAELLNPGVRCSIMLLSQDGKTLTRAIAPSMPDEFLQAVEGMAVAEGMGSCGAAVATGQRVIVHDTAIHPNWAPFRDFAKQLSIAACWSQPIRDAGGNILGALAFHHRQPATPNASQLDELFLLSRLTGIAIAKAHGQDQIRSFAFRDPLTGLANRRALDQHIDETLARCKENDEFAAVIVLDLDNFKPLNDQHGHQAGDELLVQVARRLVEHVRESDCVARVGGDEFIVLVGKLGLDPAYAVNAAKGIAEKLRVVLEEPYFVEVKDSVPHALTVEHHCSASLGVKLISGASVSRGDPVIAADKAMYLAKESGRNRVVCADETP